MNPTQAALLQKSNCGMFCIDRYILEQKQNKKLQQNLSLASPNMKADFFMLPISG